MTKTDKKAILKDLLSYIFFAQSIPEDLKQQTLDLIAENTDNEKLLQHLHDEFQQKIEAEDVSGMRQVLQALQTEK